MAGHNSAIGGGGFHHIAIRCSDIDKSIRFYTQVLGCSQKTAWGAGDKRVVLLDGGDGNYVELFAGGQNLPKADKLAAGALWHFAFRSNNVDAAIERCRQAGAKITIEPKSLDLDSVPPTTIRIGFCEGPDGESIEFFDHPSL